MREFMVEQTEDGRKITATEVHETLAAYYEKVKGLSRAAVSELAPVEKKVGKKEIDPDDSFAAENWLLLLRMLDNGASIYFSSTTDAENGERTISATLTTTRVVDGRPRLAVRTAAADHLEKVVLDLTTTTREKLCSKCGETKPVAEFSRLKSSVRDGRNHRCLACERERVAKHDAKEKGPRAAASHLPS